MSKGNLKEKFPEKEVAGIQENKRYGIGIRHLQMFCMTLTMVCLIIARASMGIAVLAMSFDGNHYNSSSTYVDANVTNNEIKNGTQKIKSNITFSGRKYDESETDNFETSTFIYESINNIDSSNEAYNGTTIIIDGIIRYNWDKKTQSLILASFFWGYVWMQIPAGILAKNFGGKSILLFALMSNCFICCLVPTFAAVGGWMLICASRTAMGLTQACLFPATHTLLGQWLPENERTSYVGVVYAGMQLGTIIAMPLCGVLADTAIGWKLIFYVIAGILMLNAAFWYWFSASTPREHRMISPEERQYIEAGLNVSKERPPTPWKYILRSGPMWVLLAPHFGFAMSFVLFFVDMPTYLEKGLQISLKESALLSALPYIGMWVGSIVSSFVSEWIFNKGLVSLTVSRKIFQSISQFGVATGLVVLSFLGPESKALAVVTLVCILTASGFSSAGFIVNQLDLSPNYAGIIISLLNFIANFGSVLMPITTSYILQNDSSNVPRWRWVFLFMAGLCVSANIIHLLFGTSKRQDWDDPKFLSKLSGGAGNEEIQPALENEEKEGNGTNRSEQKETENK